VNAQEAKAHIGMRVYGWNYRAKRVEQALVTEADGDLVYLQMTNPKEDRTLLVKPDAIYATEREALLVGVVSEQLKAAEYERLRKIAASIAQRAEGRAFALEQGTAVGMSILAPIVYSEDEDDEGPSPVLWELPED
jgi:hypothetical protein